MVNKTGTKIKCKKCGYSWLTQSKMYFVPCPRCHIQIQIRSTKKESIGDEKHG
jgi:Zn finger protein HypA/HybF involved in hydrogenase expression